MATEQLVAAVESGAGGTQEHLTNFVVDGKDNQPKPDTRQPKKLRSKKMNNSNAENTQHNTQDLSQPALEMSAVIADLQSLASALKGKKGSSSPESKDRVKYNALRHGFTGQVLIMTPEEHQKFAAFVKGIMTDLAPSAPTRPSSPTPWPKKHGA